jgi:apolipoprotein N-acyltransferase
VIALLLPLAAGAASVFGFAPFYLWPVPIAALAVLFFAWTRSATKLQAALSGFAFGLGYFLAGVSWVYVSLHDFGSMPALLAGLATFLFCAYLAIFPAAAGALLARFFAEPRARLIAAPALFVLLEWLRGWLFTGFPWLTVGTSQVPGSPLAGFAPYVGAYGTSLAAAGAAALLAALLASDAWRHARAALAAGLAALFLVGAGARVPAWTEPAGEPVAIALLQGNVPQEIKWREDVRTKTLIDYRKMILEARGRVVVIPETALPAFLDQLPPEYLESLRAHAREAGKEILLGTVEREFRPGGDYVYYNSLVRLTGDGTPAFRKRHLVPFGEFIPPGFRFVLSVLHIPLSDFSRGAGKQAPLVAAGVPFGVAICYEDIFGEEVIDLLPEAQVLVNVSNDAWFGKSFAAQQHLQASQMRALETGRWMVRSTNPGATAAIEPHGRVVSQLEPFTTGTLVAEVVPMRGMTPYARIGNAGALLLVVALLGAAYAYLRRR